ncbi:hypothetical protein TorRG33x02_224700 [Trema orientale]|uniref:Uncharacterized protein n=1 Tax=Trema orientale TaxID=63057 RepID=A0A2P5E8C2_TREOI|nr:hypothetical protein TorRG33x02_224700 [Trema orientale]
MICNILTPNKTLSTCSDLHYSYLCLSLSQLSTQNQCRLVERFLTLTWICLDNWNLVLDTLEPVEARAGSHFGSIAYAV